jgi:hypothetical protein
VLFRKKSTAVGIEKPASSGGRFLAPLVKTRRFGTTAGKMKSRVRWYIHLRPRAHLEILR